MTGNMGRLLKPLLAPTSRIPRASASSQRVSQSIIDIDILSQRDEQKENSFISDPSTDIDEDSDKAPQHARMVRKCPLEDDPQQITQVRSRLRFLTENSPSPALSGPTAVFLSQEQDAQIHSGHHRVDSPHSTPSVLGSQRSLTQNIGRQTTRKDHIAFDIVDTVTSLSDRSNNMRGEERIVYENAANMIRYHKWFVNPFMKPSENDLRLESYWEKAANKLGWAGFAMLKNTMTFLKSRESSAQSHLVSETRNTVWDFYYLLYKQPTEIKAKVSYLLENDRIPCHPSKQEVSFTRQHLEKDVERLIQAGMQLPLWCTRDSKTAIPQVVLQYQDVRSNR
ncbi:hypothetical protein HOY82DRAFT_538435 [Tuber indicum]|nr:hypothetical protein HOY82DRAFT_538435 [Tuber indicum]